MRGWGDVGFISGGAAEVDVVGVGVLDFEAAEIVGVVLNGLEERDFAGRE